MKLSIYEVNRILNEGTAEEVAQLQAQISTIDAQIQRSTQPLVARKNRLTTMLAQKQKQLGNEQSKTQSTPPSTPTT